MMVIFVVLGALAFAGIVGSLVGLRGAPCRIADDPSYRTREPGRRR